MKPNGCPFHYTVYRSEQAALIERVIQRFPLALITSIRDGEILASHVPVFRDVDGSLLAHADRLNLQFVNQRLVRARLVFMGPQSYIPPEAYATRQLPTWNYVSVHMEASIEVIDDPDAIADVLRLAAARLQPAEAPYQFEKNDPRVVRNLHHIVALRLRTLWEEGRFKLSQDKCAADQRSAMEHLLSRNSSQDRSLVELLLGAGNAATE